MQPITSDWALNVIALDRTVLDRQLDSAVETAKAAAMQEGRRGIIVTRHSPATFTVGLSDDVPYGMTREQYAW